VGWGGTTQGEPGIDLTLGRYRFPIRSVRILSSFDDSILSFASAHFFSKAKDRALFAGMNRGSALPLLVDYPSVDFVSVKTVVAADLETRNLTLAHHFVECAPINP
jgi:hypothetical protein